jgi:hypothetical protein
MDYKEPEGLLKSDVPLKGKQPPFYPVMILLVLVMGIVFWLLKLPWQANLPITLFFLLVVIASKKLGTLLKKRTKSDINTFTNPAITNNWSVFWILLMYIVIMLALAVFYGLAEKYSWHPWLIWWLSISLAVVLEISIYIYKKRSRKKNKNNPPPSQSNTP